MIEKKGAGARARVARIIHGNRDCKKRRRRRRRRRNRKRPHENSREEKPPRPHREPLRQWDHLGFPLYYVWAASTRVLGLPPPFFVDSMFTLFTTNFLHVLQCTTVGAAAPTDRSLSHQAISPWNLHSLRVFWRGKKKKKKKCCDRCCGCALWCGDYTVADRLARPLVYRCVSSDARRNDEAGRH